MNIFTWLSGNGQQVYGKFACIIGEYMQKKNFQDCHQMSELARSIIFLHVQAKSELKNFRQDPGEMGGQSSFTMCRLNLN